MKLVARPATLDDLRRVHPDQSCSWRAWACDMDGRLVGVVGLALTRPYHCIFVWFDEVLRPHLKCLTVLRLLKKLESAIESARAPVMAVRDRNERKAVHILKRLGFRFHELADGDAIYIWERA